MVIKFPFVSEKAGMMLENENKLQFLVDLSATKDQIRAAVEKEFGQEVAAVRTLVTMKGEKKAIVSFANENSAEEILSRLGVM
jgi:large subunit ribosomal protein L23